MKFFKENKDTFIEYCKHNHPGAGIQDVRYRYEEKVEIKLLGIEDVRYHIDGIDGDGNAIPLAILKSEVERYLN